MLKVSKRRRLYVKKKDIIFLSDYSYGFPSLRVIC